MTPDALFVLTLAVKMAVTAMFFVGATITAERAGPVVGGLISTLPISAGPAYVFLAFDHDTAFIAKAALGSFVVTAAICVFALVYAALAQRRRLSVSAGSALLVWFAVAAILRSVAWTTVSAIVMNATVFASCLLIGARYRHAPRRVALRRWYDIPLRASMVAALVAFVVVVSASVGPALTGMIAAFPIVLFSLMIILHSRLGGPGAAAVLANSMIGLVGFDLFCLTLHFVVVPLGFAAGFATAVAVNAGVNLTYWVLHRRSVRA